AAGRRDRPEPPGPDWHWTGRPPRVRGGPGRSRSAPIGSGRENGDHRSGGAAARSWRWRSVVPNLIVRQLEPRAETPQLSDAGGRDHSGWSASVAASAGSPWWGSSATTGRSSPAPATARAKPSRIDRSRSSTPPPGRSMSMMNSPDSSPASRNSMRPLSASPRLHSQVVSATFSSSSTGSPSEERMAGAASSQRRAASRAGRPTRIGLSPCVMFPSVRRAGTTARRAVNGNGSADPCQLPESTERGGKMGHRMVTVNRSPHVLLPDASRVLALPFFPGETNFGGDRSRVDLIVERIQALSDEEVRRQVERVTESFAGRHRNLEEVWDRHAERAAGLAPVVHEFSPERRKL